MADNNSPRGSDPIGQSNSSNQQSTNTQNASSDSDLLKDIDATLKTILNNMGKMSQSAANSSMPGSRRNAPKWSVNRSRGGTVRMSGSGIFDSFTDGIEQALMDSIGASGFAEQMKKNMASLAESMGVEMEDLPNVLGKELGKYMTSKGLGKSISDVLKQSMENRMRNMNQASARVRQLNITDPRQAFWEGMKTSASSWRRNSWTSTTNSSARVSNIRQPVANASQSSSAASNVLSNALGNANASQAAQLATPAAEAAGGLAAAEAGGGLATAAQAAGGLAPVAAQLGAVAPHMFAVSAAMMLLDKGLESLGPAIEGTKKMFAALTKAANRYQESRKAYVEIEKKRLADDYNTMVRKPFEILEEAASKVYEAWDSSIRKISGTQGYNKENVQTLMSSYAARLRDEGLTNVVSGADIITNLSSVLDAGLSGEVAEEFSYLVTKLNAAIPTQDFFSYASTYASVAANAIKDGYSQSEAIQYANSQMEQFASNVLYASRQLSGGFSTGLKEAQQLFDYSVQIANASKIGDASTISGVLTSVSAIAGAVAPDLASGLVDAVVKAATGGNSSEIVALRSLAGINASNTEFLKALASDPQKIFADLFANLAKMQNMSNDNFMEVAEGLSSVFGISMDAFARVDFNYLANAISDMNVNNASLSENMELLVSGQTTTTTEQLKMAQINQYMLEEGLSYVLDNETARVIQQHMWDEQIARDLQEASYAVELQGAGLDFLEGLAQTAINIANIINPFAWGKKIQNVEQTKNEIANAKAAVKEMLQLTNVGTGRADLLYNLTTTGRDLGVAKPLVELLGSQRASAVQDIGQMTGWFDGGVLWGGRASSGAFADDVSAAAQQLLRQEADQSRASRSSSVSSLYSWGSVSKSTAAAIQARAMNSVGLGASSISSQSEESAAAAMKAKSNANFEKFMETMQTAVDDGKSYEEWVNTAKLFGISDYAQALDDYGTTEQQMKGAFGNHEAQKASKYSYDRDKVEDEFWKQATSYALNQQEPWLAFEKLLVDNQATMISELVKANTELTNIKGIESTFYKEYLTDWRDYYINHSAYSEATLNSYDVADIKNAEKDESGQAVLALAEALTRNNVELKDPAVQTNVILAKILIVVEAIMQANNKTGGLSIPDALASLGLGMLQTSDT